MSSTKLTSKAQKSLTTQEYMAPAKDTKQKHLTPEQKQKLEAIFKMFNSSWPREDILIELEENGFDDTAVVNKRMDNQDTWKEVKKVTKSEYIAQKKKKHSSSDGSTRGGKKGGKGRKSDRKPKSNEDGEKSASPTEDKPPQTSEQNPEETATQGKTDTNGSAAEHGAEQQSSHVGSRKVYSSSRQKNFKPAREQPPKPKQPSLADILRKQKEKEQQQAALQQEQTQERKPRAQRGAPTEKRAKKAVEIIPSEMQESTQHAPSFAEIVAKGPQQPVQPVPTASVLKAEPTKQVKQQPQPAVPAVQSVRPAEPAEEQEEPENDAENDGGQPLEEEEQEYEEQTQQTQEENVILPNSTFGVNSLQLQFGSFGVSDASNQSQQQQQQQHQQQQQQQYQNQQQVQHTTPAPAATQQQQQHHEPEQQPSAPSLNQQPQEYYTQQSWQEQEQQQYQYPQQPEQFHPNTQQANLFQYQQQQFEKQQEQKQPEQSETAKAQQFKYQTPYTPVMAGNQYPQGYPYYMMNQYHPYYQYPKNYPPPAFHYPKNPYATYPQYANTAAAAANSTPTMGQYPGYVPHSGYVDDNAANMEYSKLMQPNYYGAPQQTQQLAGADKQRPAQKTDKRAQGQEEPMQDSKFPYEARHFQQQQYMPYGNYNAAAFMHQQYPPQHPYMMNQQAAQLEQRMRQPQKPQPSEQQWGGQYNQQ